MRPLGPEPLTVASAMPWASAIRRASGLALTRSADATTGAAAATGTTGATGAGAATLGAGATAAAFFGAGVASPSPCNRMMTWPTGTPSVPAATTSSTTTPSSMLSTSIVALSVSISASTSPDLTASPTLTSHFETVPVSIVGDRAGMVMSIICSKPSSPRAPRRRVSAAPVFPDWRHRASAHRHW